MQFELRDIVWVFGSIVNIIDDNYIVKPWSDIDVPNYSLVQLYAALGNVIRESFPFRYRGIYFEEEWIEGHVFRKIGHIV